MKVKNIFLLLFVAIAIIVLFNSFVTNILSYSSEVDSFTYHIPLARNFINLNFTQLDVIPQGLGYYPGIGELILALFMLTRVSIILYNPVILIFLFYSLKKLGEINRLKKINSLFFAFSICLTPTVIRLLTNQKVDVLVLLLFTQLLISLIKLNKNNITYLKIGFFAGLLIGVKYSGILYATTLLVVFIKQFFKYLNLRKFFLFIIPTMLLGLSWYLRNYLLKGNPFYPVSIFGLQGNPDFFPEKWTFTKTLFSLPKGWWLVAQAYVSEYLLWAVTPFVVFGYVAIRKIKKLSIEPIVIKLFLIGLINFLFLLPQHNGPSLEINISEVRFSYVSITPMILGTFLIAQKHKFITELLILTLLTAISVLPLFDYHPKILFLCLIMMCGYLIIKHK